VLVVGAARTGLAVARFCAARGARVTLSEIRPQAQLGEVTGELLRLGVVLECGGHREDTFRKQDLIVPSPGVPPGLPELQAARAAGRRIWSEVELAGRFLRGRLVGITGSNGKTTTSALLGHILAVGGIATQVGGNIGVPLISLVESSTKHSVTVCELSSFQLELTEKLRPDVALLLNLTADHLDRHPNFESYVAAKMKIFSNQRPRDAAVVNAGDVVTTRLLNQIPSALYRFSRKETISAGTFLDGGRIIFRRGSEVTPLLDQADISLRGAHNLENVLAAACAARLVGASPESVRAGVSSFAGVEHRLEFVAEVNGVEFFNDSKATNVDSTLKAIDAFPRGLILILGGKDKGSDYTVLRDALRMRVVHVLLIGQAADKIARQIEGAVPFSHAGTLERAVQLGFEMANPGNILLLAPACASFDQFENYEHRGRVFKHEVRKIACARGVLTPPVAGLTG
jgi:UDP-N-acetylmuramoylalanine--D-glutamate ligase